MTVLRLPPSGPPILSADGGPLEFGPGARLRLNESVSTMGGSQQVPITNDANGVVSPDGFGAGAAANPVLALFTGVKPNLNYRAGFKVDLLNSTDSNDGTIVIFLEAAIDGGAFSIVSDAAFFIPAANWINGESTGDGSARQMEIAMEMRTGTSLGILPTSTGLQLRARMFSIGETGMVVSSPATAGQLTGLEGSIHLWLEECF